MSGERQASLVVATVSNWIATQLPACLTAVETERSLAAGSLTQPVDIITADLPSYGGDTPIIEVFEGASKRVDTRLGHYIFEVTVIATHACDADVEAGRQFIRDYSTALVDCLSVNPGMGVGNFATNIETISFAGARGSDSKILHHVAIEMVAEIQEP